jgi:membrane protease YdiL (CAAX protease family)
MPAASKSFPEPSNSAPPSAEKGSLGRQASSTIWLQLGVAYALLETTLWTPEGRLQILWMTLTAICILLFTLRGRYSAREMGLARPSISATVWTVGGGIVLAGIIPLLAALTDANSAPTHALPLRTAWQYVIWTFVQQFMLQSLFYVRMESLLGSRRAVFATAILFAAVHIPNPVLTFMTLLGGLFFCEMFRRYRNIYPLGLAHAMLGLTVAASFSDAVLHHMRVGIACLRLH